MKITVEIDEEVLRDAVYAVLVDKISKEVQKDWGEGRRFRNDTKEVMREVIKANMDEFSDRAIAAAAKSIENRGIKRALADLMKEE